MGAREVDRLPLRDFDRYACEIEAEAAALEKQAKAQHTAQRQARARQRR